MEAIANSYDSSVIELFAIDVWDGSPAQAQIFPDNSGFSYPVLMLGNQNGIPSDYNCGIDYVFIIGGEGIIQWRGYPNSSGLEAAVSDAVDALATSAAPVPLAGNKLLPCYPNPFNPMTNIPFEIAGDSGNVNVKLEILDVRGRVVQTIASGSFARGERHQATWNGTDRSGRRVPSGTYMSRLRVEGAEPQSRLLTMVK